MKKIAFLLATFILTSSCCTIVSGSRQKINFTSTPASAKVFVDNIEVGTTPFTAKLKRNEKKQNVKIILDGYKPYEVTLTRKFNAWFIGNILFGGLIGMGIDAGTGSMYKLSEKDINATFSKNVAITKTKDGVFVAVVMHADENWEKIASLEKE